MLLNGSKERTAVLAVKRADVDRDDTGIDVVDAENTLEGGEVHVERVSLSWLVLGGGGAGK